MRNRLNRLLFDLRLLGKAAPGAVIVQEQYLAGDDYRARARRRDGPSLVAISSERLDHPPWSAFDPWLRLGIGDRPPYQLNWHICEFFNATGEGVDREKEAGGLGL